MSELRQSIKKTVPSSIWKPISNARYAIQRGLQWPMATFHPLRRDSIQKLGEFKGKHTGERCFIIGNGPSLNQTDLSKLEGEYTFGMNRFYMKFPELGFATSYFVSINTLVIEQCAEDIRSLTIPKFLSWRSRDYIEPAEDLIFLHTTYTGPKFAIDARSRLWEGATVTYVALQLAYFMGFETVILIGVDHSFKSKGKPNTTVVSAGDDPNHFDSGYFGKGFRWQLPDLDTSEKAYLRARKFFEDDSRLVLDATVGGKLQIFPKVSYDSLFE